MHGSSCASNGVLSDSSASRSVRNKSMHSTRVRYGPCQHNGRFCNRDVGEIAISVRHWPSYEADLLAMELSTCRYVIRVYTCAHVMPAVEHRLYIQMRRFSAKSHS